MSLPELIANSPTPGQIAPIALLAVAVATAPAANTIETWTLSGSPPAALSTAGQFHFVIGSEICLDTTGATGTSRTVVRGQEGSTITTHPLGAGVFHYLTAGGLGAFAVQAANNGSDFANADSTRANLKVASLRHAQCVATTNQSLSGALPTIDSYAVQDGDRVLLTGQTTGSQNGPWVAHVAGWVRPNDYPAGMSLTSRTITVTGGTVYAVTIWALASTATITVDTTSVTWSLTGRQTGSNLALTGNTLALAPTITSTRITRRVLSVTQSATPAINSDNADVASITGLAQAITSMTTNLTGTPVDGDRLLIRITDNGTGRAITWGAKFEASTVALPTTTVLSAMLCVDFLWNTATSKWRCLAAS